MIKSIKINLFEKNRNEVFNEISIEGKTEYIYINNSNKHLNGNIIDEYIKLLAKPPQLKQGPDPTKSSTNNAMLISDENIDIYQENIDIIKKIADEINIPSFNTLLGFKESDVNGINKYLDLSRNRFEIFEKKDKLTIDFYNLIKK